MMSIPLYRIILTIFLPTALFSQTNEIPEKTFYGLPINSSRSKIKSKILSDNRFLEKTDSVSSLLYFKKLYYGNILAQKETYPLGVDSATIELTYAIGMRRHPNSKMLESTIIRIKYFVPSATLSNELSTEIWNTFKNVSTDTSELAVGKTGDSYYAYGKQIKLKRKKYLPQIKVLQQHLNETTYLVIIEYERYGD